MNGNEVEFGNKEMKILARDVSRGCYIPTAQPLQTEENTGSDYSGVFTE